MSGVAGLPVVDHHCHLAPSGEGVRAAARFRAAGGTHLFLATQNYAREVPRSLDEYRRQFETTERLGRSVAQETGVVVHLVVAPFPVDLVGAAAALGVDAALQLHLAALDLSAAWVREHRAVALGEVGWPHFPTEPAVESAAQAAFDHALELAREVGCPAVVHSPDLDPAAWAALGERARRKGLPEGKVVKHYARARRPETVGRAVAPSYLARRELVGEVLAEPSPWFLETDFLDDPARPGAVLDLATIPRRAAALARNDPPAAERLVVPFVRSVREVYGLALEVPG